MLAVSLALCRKILAASLERPRLLLYGRLQLRTTFLGPAAPATAASPEASPSSDSSALDARVGELERRL